MMTYKSPIDLIVAQAETEVENGILRAVQRVGINIDKDELMRALAYDRNQYVRGYYDRDSEVIRCKDCIYHRYTDDSDRIPYCEMIGCGYLWRDDEFCNRGKRR